MDYKWGTWICHICGAERPDTYISVFSIDTSEEHGLHPGTMKQNIRYCNDHQDCIAKATSFRFAKKKEEG